MDSLVLSKYDTGALRNSLVIILHENRIRIWKKEKKHLNIVMDSATCSYARAPGEFSKSLRVFIPFIILPRITLIISVFIH